ncbi:MAG: plasmid stabilization protein [Gammaproteobacteria bacterium]|nr:MAG: plasmid stabilization protein [Gammaproteobacteria bacterium]
MGFYNLTEEAKGDLNRIWLRGFTEWNEAQADRYYHAFFDRFELIAEQPFSYPPADYIREGFRKNVCGVDTIYYRVAGEGVEIVAIIGRQDVGKILKKP